ncbi:MAG: hypothetical protein DWQ10_15205 [Calditrichaeota bacterium]|nr:MAG: hypothetical protein DWQ10_15205 [Calditrichota bacterium]
MKKSIITFFQLLPAVLSFLLIAAHFSRAGNTILLIVSLVLLLSLLIRHSLVVIIARYALILAALEWIRTTFMLVAKRMETGQSWERLAIILGVVTIFTLVATLVFRFKNVRERYKLM